MKYVCEWLYLISVIKYSLGIPVNDKYHLQQLRGSTEPGKRGTNDSFHTNIGSHKTARARALGGRVLADQNRSCLHLIWAYREDHEGD